jgi:hypothetical protein
MPTEDSHLQSTHDIPADTPLPDSAVVVSTEDADATALAAFEKGLAVEAGEIEPDDPGDNAQDVEPDEEQIDAPVDPEPQDPVDEVVEDAAATAQREIDDEIEQRGLKGKTADRFRGLANENREMREAIKAAGVGDIGALVAKAAEASQTAERWMDTVTSTGATPQQFGNALGYLKLINSRDPTQMRQAYDAMATEQAWLAKELGLTPTGGDALDADPELKQRVRDGDVPRDVAEQLLAARAAQKLVAANREQAAAQTQAQTARQQAEQQGHAQIRELGTNLRSRDADFEAKVKAIGPAVALIQQRLPPDQWAQAIYEVYTQTPAPPKVRSSVSPMPLRPTGSSPALTRKPKSDMDAFEMGLEAERESRLG